MFGSKIKLRESILEQVNAEAEKLSCTPSEFVEKCVERELERLKRERASAQGTQQLSSAEVEDIVSKMKGLGYLE